MQSVRRRKVVEPAEVIAQRLGHDPREALRALRLLDSYKAKVAANFDEMGNLGREELGVF